ncbi:MAG TPA: DUF177 domain-containing protein [Methylocystis sp.]|nr:DUF177 domain-containing protein [Methylocystis sp.]
MTKIAKRRENSTGERRLDAPPLSRPLAATGIPTEGLDVVVRANEAECAALARDNALVAVLWLEAPFHVARFGHDGLKVQGSLRAEVRQTCVVTLEDFDAVIEEPVSVRFAPPLESEKPSHGRREKALSAEDALEIEADGPDPLIGGVVDLGALAGEFLTLGLDPYPRKPGATFEEPAPAAPEASPFAVLSKRGAGADGE